MNLPPLPFTVLDTETTGFVPRVHDIIEFASMQVKEGEIVDTYEQLLMAKEEIPPHIQALTHIKPQDVAGKPRFAEKRDEIRSHIGEGTLLVGQNLGFDLGMLKGHEIDLHDRPWVDTSLLASLVFPELRSYSLGYMSTVLSLNHEPVHRALGDVRATLEMLGKIWERLNELPASHRAEAKDIMQRAGGGYQLLFDALPDGGSEEVPAWMKRKERKAATGSEEAHPIERPEAGVVDVLEEAIHPQHLQALTNACAADKSTAHWLTVKNLESSLRRLKLPTGVTVLYPPFLLLDPDAKDRLLAQETMTPEEALISLKLLWFSPTHRHEVAIHGGEKDVWNGKLACTDSSALYRKQFARGEANTFLLDHRQLLQALKDPEHPATALLDSSTHIVIDDASMLEDTATKAYGAECKLDDLRAASQGDEELMKFTDVLTLWSEIVRNQTDLHFVTGKELDRPETKGVRDQHAALLERTDLTLQTRELLASLPLVFGPDATKGNIVWIELRQGGSIVLHAAPERVEEVLDATLYSKFATTLLAPAGCEKAFPGVIPAKRKVRTAVSPLKSSCTPRIAFPKDTLLADYLKNPPAGKTVILAGSKRIIEQAFIEYSQALDEKGITMICQGMSGGQNRMEAEFFAAPAPALWLLTPWTYEGIELPEETVDHLIIDVLPFDHPGHPLIQKRKDHYKSGFNDYCVPRLKHRLFRLLRSFCRHRTSNGDVHLIDKRLHEKEYGMTIQEYLEQFSAEDSTPPSGATEAKQLKLF